MTTWNGYTLLTNWETNTGSQTALAKEGTRTVFVKRYKTVVRPERDSAYYERSLKRFELFVNERKILNRKLSAVSPRGGNLVVPHKSFVSTDGMYTEVTDYYENAVRGGETWSFFHLLSKSEQRLVLKTAAAALALVHGQNIVHSDIKVDNIVIVRNAAGNFVAKLIDFDNSYVQGRVPDEVMGTVNYHSPEHALYTIMDDPAQKAAIKKELGTKTDIFSLGVAFHRWLSGEYPEKTVGDEKWYAWQLAINEQQTVPLSTRIDPMLRELIRKMLSAQPEDRPTASEVLNELCAMDSKDPCMYQAPWPQHNLIWNQTTMKNNGVHTVTKKMLGERLLYWVTVKNGKTELLTEEQMKTEWARAATGYESPRGEDHIRWNQSLLKERGIVEISKIESDGVKSYILRRGNATAATFTAAELSTLEYALPTRKTVNDPDAVKTGFLQLCWPEHNIKFRREKMMDFGYTGVELVESSEGLHVYAMIRKDGRADRVQGHDIWLLTGIAVRT